MQHINPVSSLLTTSSIPFNVFIGYDRREALAAEVCHYSIQQRLKHKVDVRFLKSIDLQEYNRPPELNQSTDFTYTRFMIPHINSFEGVSVFCDCDFLFQADVHDLVALVDLTKAVSVVKHPPYVPYTQIKMDGIPQHTMPRKNWASLMVFNNSHPANKILTPGYINNIMPGRRLHQFEWTDDIGDIPLDWNALDGYYLLENPKAIHYTDGGPWFDNYKHTMYSQRWLDEYNGYKQYDLF